MSTVFFQIFTSSLTLSPNLEAVIHYSDMFSKILAPLDRSVIGKIVFNTTLDLSQTTAAKLILLNVLSPEEEESPNMPALIGQDYQPLGSGRSVLEIYQALWQNYAARRLEMLKTFQAEAMAAGVTPELMQKIGSPGRVICDLARQLEVDLIVMGHRGYLGLDELILGSVSSYVLHQAPCSVIIVQS